MPMTAQGFQKLTYAEILEDLIERAKDTFGDDIDTDETAVMGKYLRLICKDFATQEEALEQVYLSRYIDTAVGISLDRLCPFAGITRSAATAAKLSLKLTNNGDTTVTLEMGTKFINDNGTLYHLTESLTMKAGAEAYGVIVECDEVGTVGNTLSGLSFYNTQASTISIVILAVASTGEDGESDAVLRARWKIAVAGSGGSTVDAIAGAVAQVSGVQDVKVYENDSDEEGEDGQAAHSIWVIVKADTDVAADIAAAIYASKPAGVATYAESEDVYSVTDDAGQVHQIRFDFAQATPFDLLITCYDASVEMSTPDEELAAAMFSDVAAYMDGLKIGGTVYISEMYSSIQAVVDLPIIDISLIYKTTNSYNYYYCLSKTQYPYLNVLTVWRSPVNGEGD